MSYFSTIILLISLCFPLNIVYSSLSRLECLKTPPSQYITSLKTVEGMVEDIASMLREVHNVEDFRVSNSIETCLELLDMSIEEIGWCISAIRSQDQEKYTGGGDLSRDLKTWFSAILANTDTCMNAFDETNGIIRGKISNQIHKVDSMINELLDKVQLRPIVDNFDNQGRFPSWVKKSDQKLLKKITKDVFDVIVAGDGTGNYTKIKDAVSAAPKSSKRRYVIKIKKGVYLENIEVANDNIMMIGEGVHATIISGHLSHDKNNLTAYQTATFGVKGRGFIARDIAFRNTAGPIFHQAVALRSNSDHSVFYKCGIFGYQDSLYAHSNRQFYKDCIISGTVDFVFGYAAAVFQDCQLLVKKGMPTQSNTITAHGGKYLGIQTGFSLQFCNISADFDLLPYVKSTPTFLGRPWKEYSTTVFMESYISDVVNPKGWLEWNGSQYLDTLYYAEFKNHGPGASTQNRVKWPRYHALNDPTIAIRFTVAHFISGNQWIPSTGVPFTSEL